MKVGLLKYRLGGVDHFRLDCFTSSHRGRANYPPVHCEDPVFLPACRHRRYRRLVPHQERVLGWHSLPNNSRSVHRKTEIR